MSDACRRNSALHFLSTVPDHGSHGHLGMSMFWFGAGRRGDRSRQAHGALPTLQPFLPFPDLAGAGRLVAHRIHPPGPRWQRQMLAALARLAALVCNNANQIMQDIFCCSSTVQPLQGVGLHGDLAAFNAILHAHDPLTIDWTGIDAEYLFHYSHRQIPNALALQCFWPAQGLGEDCDWPWPSQPGRDSLAFTPLSSIAVRNRLTLTDSLAR